ncbi:MAG: ABC transporter permease [Thermoflexales bacterium]|nr:ABC transporter permease [Thermoflexales bacterium]
MVRFILRRLLRAAIILLIYQFLLFALIQAMPGDFVSTMIGLPPSLRQGFRATLGLTDPLWKQYLRWMARFFTGDLGTTFRFPHRPVSQILLEMALPTLFLFMPATLISFSLGIWLGKRLGWAAGPKGRLRSLMEGSLIALSVMAYNSFPLWLAFVLVQIFALRLRWFPAEKMLDFNRWIGVPVSVARVVALLFLTVALVAVAFVGLRYWAQRWRPYSPWVRRAGLLILISVAALSWYLSGLAPLALDLLWHLTLPLATVVLFSFGETMLLMRLFMRQQVREDYVYFARARGLPPAQIRDRHMAPLAVMPILTRFLIQLPFVLLGSLVVEIAFFWRGLGSTLLSAIDFQDIPVIMGVFSVVGILMLIAHGALDILHAWLDPRLRERRYVEHW